MSSKSHSRSSEGDWTCPDPDCGNVNFARRSSCNRCGADKADYNSKSKKQIGIEIGKAAAEKSRGLFSADDWQCTKCGNVNWARRNSCNMCNAPKVGDVEERTGYGGGYNDRGVVEYKERQDSDDEYDEFGRKKKKYRKATTDDGPAPKRDKRDDSSSHKSDSRGSRAETSRATRDDDEEEEDDDEDDEDGDLSKYDLSGWGDDDEDDEKKDSKK